VDSDSALLERIERFYDAVPRYLAASELVGPLVVFSPQADSWPYYVRPALGATDVNRADVDAARARRRELGLPESFEWVHDTTPSLRAAAVESGLAVHEHPLMVLRDAQPSPAAPPGIRVVRLDADDDDLARATAVAHVGFDHAGTAVGPAGAVERDACAGPLDVAASRVALRGGWLTTVAAYDDEGPLSVGSAQSALGVAEVVGVATLPAARRRGLAALVTAALVEHSRAAGVTTVFLSADDDDVARVYGRLGFERIATACIAEPAS
jgi:ribosomal protein S18 acetylase RimI-like enzyme